MSAMTNPSLLARAQAMFPGRKVDNAFLGGGKNLHIFFADGEQIEIEVAD